MRTFTSECPLPPEGTNYVSSPPIRGTLQILWSSLSVLVLCTWSAVQLNVPYRIKAKTKMQRVRRMCNRFLTRTLWMSFNLLAPEWVLTKALVDWMSVAQLEARYKTQANSDNVASSRSHIHFANMGGFGISFQDVIQKSSNSDLADSVTGRTQLGNASDVQADLEKNGPDASHVAPTFNWLIWCKAICATLKYGDDKRAEEIFGLSQRLLAQKNADSQGWQIDNVISDMMASITPKQMKQFVSSKAEYDEIGSDLLGNLLLLKANLWIPDAAQLLEARELGLIESLPDVDDDDLNDRDKNNGLLKVIAAGQVCWFVLQFLVRTGNGQANTQLEVMVFAFAVCSVAAYALGWSRPKDPTYTIILKAARRPKSIEELLRMAVQGPNDFSESLRTTIWISNCRLTPASIKHSNATSTTFLVFGSAIVSVFGGLHCIAWNYVFPTRVDQIIWQVCSLATAAFVPAVWILAILSVLGPSWLDKRLPNGISVSTLFERPLWVFFGIVRLIILVEVYRCLGFQPPGAFETTWLSNIPHVG